MRLSPIFVEHSQEHTTENSKAVMDTNLASHFAIALKNARLAKRWKQEDLAKKLHVTLRAVVSWETGARIPSPGMVFLLCMLLADDAGHGTQIVDLLRHDLLISYLRDDMERQTHVHQNEAFRAVADQGIERLSHLSEEQYCEQEPQRLPLSFEQVALQDLPERNQRPSLLPSQQDEASMTTLQQLFTLFEQLRQRPNLIAVVHDFLREMTHA